MHAIPARRLDAAGDISALAVLAKMATRLHPRLGAPTVHDSSVAGPLLWPVDEPWPTCPLAYCPEPPLTTPADVRAARALLTEAWSRPRGPRENLLTPQEGELLARFRSGTLDACPAEPLALMPLVQLYARDVPDLPFPEGTDLLQVLWVASPQVEGCSPALQLRWRAAEDVREVLVDQREPAFIEYDDLVAEPCVLDPERVREYPPDHLLDRDLYRQAAEWATEHGLGRWNDYALAPGWKAGGWPAAFTFRDPAEAEELQCGECGGPVEALLTIGGKEWDWPAGSDRPSEYGSDTVKPAAHPYRSVKDPTKVTIARGYTLQIYYCLASPAHLPRAIVQ